MTSKKQNYTTRSISGILHIPRLIRRMYGICKINGSHEQIAGRNDRNLIRKQIVTCILLSNMLPVWADDIVDVYGVTPTESQQIMQKYATSVSKIEIQLSNLFLDSNHGIEHPKKLHALYQQKRKLLKTIKQDGHFAFVNIQTVAYPDKSNIYSTIEIIPDIHSPRLKFVSHTSSTPQTTAKNDLITEMMTYHQKVIRLLMTKQIDLTDNVCPVYHCAVPFTHPELKPYLTLFNEGMKKHKTEVIDTLNHDPNPERRAAAAFLIGHLKDPYEIVNILSPHITDTSISVRNNVLRVIGETILRAKINNLDSRPYIALLDSPYVTDRNKSLIILYTLADSASGKKQIRENNHGRLEALATLKQPNNHDIAVKILQKIK